MTDEEREREREIGRRAAELTRKTALQCPCCGAMVAVRAIDMKNDERKTVFAVVSERRMDLYPIEQAEEDGRKHFRAGAPTIFDV